MEEANYIDDSILLVASNEEHPDCSIACQAHLLKSLASKRKDVGAVCQTSSRLLENDEGGYPMFYQCGSHLCKIKGMGGASQDLSIRQFLSSCQRNGYDSVIDSVSTDQADVRAENAFGGREHVRRQQRPTAPRAAVPTTTPSGFLVEGFHTVTTKISPPPASEIAQGVTASGTSVLSLVTMTGTSKPLRHKTASKSQVPVSTKVTIGVSVMVGILAIIALIAWHLRVKKQFRNKKRISRPIKPESLPPTPLISPSSSYAGPPPNGPLTPPPRLQERRFLLPRSLSFRRNNPRRQLNNEDAQEWAGMPLSPMPPLSPLSPLSISRAMRSPEDSEHGGITATTTISQTTSATGALGDDIAPSISVSSIFSSASTLRVASNASADSEQIRYSGATATDLPRPPPRVYEAPPAIRGLASPGPPPTRALPNPPADGRLSPLKPPSVPPMSPTRGGSPSFAAMARSSVGTSDGNGDSQRLGEEYNQSSAGRSSEVPLQSPRRVRHVRSPLLNEVCLNNMMKRG